MIKRAVLIRFHRRPRGVGMERGMIQRFRATKATDSDSLEGEEQPCKSLRGVLKHSRRGMHGRACMRSSAQSNRLHCFSDNENGCCENWRNKSRMHDSANWFVLSGSMQSGTSVRAFSHAFNAKRNGSLWSFLDPALVITSSVDGEHAGSLAISRVLRLC